MIYELPTTVSVGNVEYSIIGDGDYRAILGIFSILDDEELTQDERMSVALLTFYCDLETLEDLMLFPSLEEAAQKMFWFFNAGTREKHKKQQIKLLDWDEDSDMIIPAVNKVAGSDIRDKSYLHWWTFMSYYMSIGESVLSTVLNIREKIANSNKLEKWEREYRNKNPEYFRWDYKTAEQKDFEKWLLEQWNSGG